MFGFVDGAGLIVISLRIIEYLQRLVVHNFADMKNICLYVVITVIAMLPVPSSCKISENLPGIGEIYSDSFPSSAAERNETVALIKRSLSLHDTPLNGEPFQFAQRREGLDTTTRVEVEKYNYPFIIAARVGAYTFS